MTDNNADTIRWGIAGCGWVARDYVAPGIVAAPNARLVALYDPSADAMRRIAALTPGIDGHPTLEAFLAAPGLDAVYVATPNHLHRPLVEAAARAGKHVLCEKPMATTVADADAMVAACRAAGVVYATAFDQRWQARHLALRRIIAGGGLGTVTAARIHYACWTPGDWTPGTDQGEYENWRVDPARAGGGAYIDLAPHGFDLLQWLVGSPLEQAACLLQRRVFDYPVDDGAAVVGAFRSGALMTMNVAYNCPDQLPRRTLEIVGTKAMAVARDTMGQTPGGSLEIVSADTGEREAVTIPEADDVSPFQRQIGAFSRCLLTGEAFPFPGEDDARTLRLLLDAPEQLRAATGSPR